jgi:prephenate dehydrogenase
MDVMVVGAGAVGRWFADALVADAPVPVAVTFADADPETARDAAAALEGSEAAVPASAAAPTDAVCVAVPIPAATDVIAEYADLATDAVLDLTGTMAAPVDAMASHAPDLERLSLHPLFAPGNEPGNVAAVRASPGPVTRLVRETLTARGNEWVETTPDAHDEAMETVQARAHTAVLAYVVAAEDVDQRCHTPVSAALSALAEQVTGGDARVYAEVQAAFDDADDVAAAARKIAEADGAAFESLYEDAGR